MAKDLDKWLEGIGLSVHSALFAEHDIDREVLPELQERDLESLGLSLGHRKKLLKAIAALAEQTGTPDPAPYPVSASPTSQREAERRQVTVVFCDLVGSTELSGRFDPEDLREVMRRYQDTAAGTITRYGGTVAKFLGDGVLAYFGWPRAHEDQAERAVRAGLDVVAGVQELQFDNGIELQTRVGIATGRVVVGELVGEAATEAEAITGETPNLASRLQGLAAPDQVVIGPLTRELVGEIFKLEDIGAHRLKGFPNPVQAWLALRQGDIRSRYEAKHVGGELPLVGRSEELGLLHRSWETTKQSYGQVILVQGEAGIGKTRLIEALRARLSGEDYSWAAIRCSPYHANSALFPVIEHMKRLLGWETEQDEKTRLAKLERALNGQPVPLNEAVPLYCELLSLPLPTERYAPLKLSAKELRELTLDSIAGWLLADAERTNLLVLWEDLHWADPTTLELLTLVIEQSPTAPILNVLTYRPEFSPPWPARSHVTPITLNRLERPEVVRLVAHQAGDKPVPPEVVEHIVSKTDGVPLYVEELTKSILESDYLREEPEHYRLVGPLAELPIPATLQDSLMARLDRMPIMREVAQLGSVLGREFDYLTLDALSIVGEEELNDGLAQLVENELLYQRGRPPQARYIFKHALIQDAAYLSLLIRTRREIHRKIAELLRRRFPETAEAHPELLAHHFTEAGILDAAIDHWYLAGERARAGSANHEAVAHLSRGIALVGEVVEQSERSTRELKLQFALGGAYLQMKGHAAPEVEAAFSRARELCLEVGDAPELVPTLFGLWRTYVVQMADCAKPDQVSAEMLQLADIDGRAASRVVAHYACGFTAHVMGQFNVARRHLSEGMDLYSPADRATSDVYRFGQDPGGACCCYLALTEWVLGYPEKAAQYAADSIGLARRLDDSFTVAFALAIAAMLDCMLGDVPAALGKADEAVQLATEKDFPYFAGIGKVMQGWGQAVSALSREGIEDFRNRIADHRSYGTELFVPFFLANLADTALKADQVEIGLSVLEEAAAVSQLTGEHWWDSEIHRLMGEVAIRRDDLAAAGEWFDRATESAREGSARSLELRAAMSSASLLHARGDQQAAVQLLKPCLEWFTEGFDTADLVQAAEQLNTLA